MKRFSLILGAVLPWIVVTITWHYGDRNPYMHVTLVTAAFGGGMNGMAAFCFWPKAETTNPPASKTATR